MELNFGVTVARAMTHGGELLAEWNYALAGGIVGGGKWKFMSQKEVRELHQHSALLPHNTSFYKQINIHPEESSKITLEG